MTHTIHGGTSRPFPVAVRTECPPDDQPCPYVRLEQARERSSWPYYLAAHTAREWRRTAYQAGEQRKAATNPFNWLGAATAQVTALIEQKLAEREKAVLRPHLPHAAIMARLGLPETADAPTCPYSQPAGPPLWQKATTLMAIGSLAFTPLRTDMLPLTQAQQMEMMFAEGCVSLTGSRGPVPTLPKAPCCAPKTGATTRREKLGLQKA